MKRRHNMPFGAEYREDGSIRFRLWAPAARRVEISIEKAKRRSRFRLIEVIKAGLS